MGVDLVDVAPSQDDALAWQWAVGLRPLVGHDHCQLPLQRGHLELTQGKIAQLRQLRPRRCRKPDLQRVQVKVAQLPTISKFPGLDWTCDTPSGVQAIHSEGGQLR